MTLNANYIEQRPWGTFEILKEETTFKSKKIVVNPGQRLSYQSHKHRAEHWIVVEGVAEVTLDDVVNVLKAGQHIFIPQGSKHRVANSGKDPLVFIEVQTGTYFGEDDIIRYSDDYSRT
jgi:mannose-6-phosphate isomerase-like protein (cupin superfamily)